MQDPRALLRALFDAAIASASAMVRIPPVLPPRPKGRTVVVGAGKAAAEMARAVESAWDDPLEGLVVTRDGHGADCRLIEVVEVSHPVPDTRAATLRRSGSRPRRGSPRTTATASSRRSATRS